MAATQSNHRPSAGSTNSDAAAPRGLDELGRRVDAAHGPQPKRESAAAASLLPHHVQDLVAHLQVWAGDLDRREAELNAQKARQEIHERSFRLWSESQQQQLQQLEREATRLRDQLKQQARRLALSQ